MMKFKIFAALLLLSLTATPTFSQGRVELWPGNLSTLESIPESDVIENVKLTAAPNNGGKLDEQSFKKLMETAKPLDANDPVIRGWQYGPWYTGSFVVKDETYHFALFLGGMGSLLTPDKEQGMFMFEHKPQVKK